MQMEKSASISSVPQNLYQDSYGILALASQATLAKTPITSKVENHLRLRFMQRANGVWVMIKGLFSHSPLSFFDALVDPDVLSCRPVWKESSCNTKRKLHG